MKKMIGNSRKKMRQYWNKVMASTRNHMSIGAQYVDQLISWARRDNWRRKEKKK